MAGERLNTYKGSLSANQIAEGINAANANASRLAEDARLMLDAARYPTATALAILAIEEAGKGSILRSLALARDAQETAQCWKDYRSHRSKNVAWILPQLVSQGARSLEDLRPLFEESADHPHVLDQVKQISLYTDCLGKAHWSNPTDVIDEKLAKILVHTAELFARSRSEVSSDEIEAWARHLGPVWKTTMPAMRAALIAWSEEMKERGILPEDYDMERFVTEGL